MELDLYLRIAGSFAIVGLLLWLFSRAIRGRLGARLRGSRNQINFDPLVVVERRQLTKSNTVAIVRAGRRHVLIGFGDQGVQLLAEGDDLMEDPAEDEPEVDPDDDGGLDTVQIPAYVTTEAKGKEAVGPSPIKYQSARTRLPEASRPTPPRMSLMNALREKTVRRS